MKKFIAFVFSFSLLFMGTTRADEGMWLLPLLNELNMTEMQEMGMQLSAEEIFSINNSSLKDAIVIFGGGCTGAIVSADGLLFTNHHCGYDEIQNHSSLEHDYLKDGFWAMSREEELPNPGLTVRFLDSVANVTQKILQELSDSMLETDRRSKIRELIDEIEEEASKDGKYKASVKPLFEGNEYYLFVYTLYKDVRFVGAPPSSIGKFGYDSDNWQWPRHTGDFSIFRVYTAPDGSPAEYAEENIPLKPKYFLPVSLGGVEKGDFTFIMGYPGRTSRYKSSFGVQETAEIVNNTKILIRGKRLEILSYDMQNDPRIRIQYASKHARSSNYWKYSIGQNKGIRALKVLEKKREEEVAFQRWAEQDSARNARYGNILSGLEKTYTGNRNAMLNLNAIAESFYGATELIDFITDFQYLNKLMENPEEREEDIREEINDLKNKAEKFFKNYNIDTDITMTREIFKLYTRLVKPAQHPDIYLKIDKKYKGDMDKFVEQLFTKSFFTNREKTLAFLDNPSAKTLQKDMGFQVAGSIFNKYLEEYNRLDQVTLDKLERLYLEGRMNMNPEKSYYPDANSTMRLSYGIVDNYSPRDAVHYDEITVLKGVIQKEDTTNFEFIVPEKLKELYYAKDYGIYGVGDTMPVCFITNNDITGGNSGSPVLNDQGQLIGLAFDGNLEAMSGDIAFEPDIQRCICVDIRYVLFIIEKYAGASYLVEELKIVN